MKELTIVLKQASSILSKNYASRPVYDHKEKRFSTSEVLTNSKGETLKGVPRVLKRRECAHLLAYAWPAYKKWSVLSVIFIIQVSMNFNAAVYGNANQGISEQFGVSEQAARTGQALFLIFYAVGSELWAPWSEELGRWPILQASLALVNLWQIPVALAPTFAAVVIGRILGGLSSAGGSVTLGMINDMYSVDEQGYAVNYIVLSSVGGSVVGPLVGAFIQARLGTWRWIFWISLIFGAFVQLIHAFLVPETSPEILLDREAKSRREETRENVWGPGDIKHSITIKECFKIWGRPFSMFVREPIVLWLSLLSGFSDALIFTFIEAFTPVYAQYNFSIIQTGLAFIPLLVGYFLAYLWFIPFISRDISLRKQFPGKVEPEQRLLGLLWTAPLLSIGLFGFAWTSLGPQHMPSIPWIAPMIFSAMIGVANAAIYMSTIDYMVAAYGPYAASATGGNALARDGLSGIAAYYSTPFYSYFPEPKTLSYPSTILACIALAFTVPIYIFYWKGEQIREASKFAQTLAGVAHEQEMEEESETPGEKKYNQVIETGQVRQIENADNTSATRQSSPVAGSSTAATLV